LFRILILKSSSCFPDLICEAAIAVGWLKKLPGAIDALVKRSGPDQ
jgi:hypothetical protein